MPSQTVDQAADRSSPAPAVANPAVANTVQGKPAAAPAASTAAAGATTPPTADNSLRFAVLGDTGTGEKAQYDVAAQIWKSHAVFPYEFVILVGDNMYGSERPQDFNRKFEIPYKPLLDAKVQFYASLG